MLSPQFRRHTCIATFIALAAVVVSARGTRSVEASAPEALSAGLTHSMVPISRTVAPLPSGSLDWAQAAHVRSEVTVDFVAVNLHERATVTLGFDGTLSDADREALEGLFRCKRTGRRHEIDDGLLIKLADLAAHYPGSEIEIISAYRHPPHASRGSKHRHGRALDLRVVGVSDREVRDYLWTRWNEEVGVGFYRSQGFIHLDHRPGELPTAWTQFGSNSNYVYNPGWARRLDRKGPRHDS